MLLATLLFATVLPCKSGTPEHASATKALQKFSSHVAAIDPAADPRPLWKELHDLFAQRCFEGAAHETGEIGEPESGLALKTWWRASGDYWMRGYLDMESEPRRVVIPGTMRKALTKESPEKELEPILCAATDADPFADDEREQVSCGAETRGWMRRARDAFRLSAFENEQAHDPEHGTAPPPAAACPAALREAETPDARWSRWRSCVEAARDKTAMLPLGRFRAPAEGWLVVRGRRGHYHFCDEVRVYDLATGAAWIAQSCSGLVLRDDGSVDGKGTDAARKPKARAGRVSLDAIREAAWMILLAPEVEEGRVEYAEWIDIPAGVTPAWPDPDDVGFLTGGLGLSSWATSAQTRLAVTWKRQGAEPVERELTWPDSADAGEDHAVNLLAIADDSFVDGCPPAALPATVAAKTGAPGVGSLDAPGGVAGTQDELVQALLEIPPCVNAKKP